MGTYGQDKTPNIIVVSKAFTINIPSQQQVIEAEYVGKFHSIGLTLKKILSLLLNQKV